MSKLAKFRAWDKTKKKWLSENTHVCVSDGVIVLVEYHSVRGGIWNPKSCKQLTWAEIDNLEIVQFTGLKDKNGKEIYEGDIVASAYHGERFFVKYEAEAGAFMGENNPDAGYLSAYELIESEIIGDIYSTPELLEPPHE